MQINAHAKEYKQKEALFAFPIHNTHFGIILHNYQPTPIFPSKFQF